MPYNLPSYEQLQEQTRGLVSKLKLRVPCYIGKSYATLRQDLQILKTKYDEAVSEKPTWSRSDVGLRHEQINDIVQLLEELEPLPSPEDELQCQLILQGALIVRDRLLFANHNTPTSYLAKSSLAWGLSFFMDVEQSASAEVRCVLYNLIHKTCLAINDENKLDDWTILISCEAYRDFVNRPDVIKRHAYINKDPKTFFAHVNQVMDNAKPIAKPLIEQSTFMHFIQSIATTLSSFDQKLRQSEDGKPGSALQALVADVTFDRKTCSRKTIRNYLETNGNLSAVCLAYLRMVIWEDDFYEKLIPPQEFESAVALVDKQMMLRNQLTLLGAYLLVLMQCEEGGNALPNKDHLIRVIKAVIYKNNANGDPLTNADYNIFLEMLGDFIELPGVESLLNLSCWKKTGDPLEKVFDRLKDLVNLCRDEITNKLEEEKSARALVHEEDQFVFVMAPS